MCTLLFRDLQYVFAHQVLAVGSLLGEYTTLDMVNFVSPVAPTRLTNPPRGTLELNIKQKMIHIALQWLYT